MDAAIEDALVNWYEAERSARWWANHSKYDEVVAFDPAHPKPSVALDGLFRAIEYASRSRFSSAAMYRGEQPHHRHRGMLDWPVSARSGLQCRPSFGTRMSSDSNRTRERRWVVLVSDGRHTTIGRHSDPSESEILSAEAHLVESGLSGWLAIAEGDFHVSGRPPRLMEVRRLGQPAAAFSEAAAAFARHREEANSG